MSTLTYLKLARFIDGERPSADKFNALFCYLERKINELQTASGVASSNGIISTTPLDSQEADSVDFNSNKYWGYQKTTSDRLNDTEIKRGTDVVNLSLLVGSAANLNPLSLGSESQIIKEEFPAGLYEINLKYPVICEVLEGIADRGLTNQSNSLIFNLNGDDPNTKYQTLKISTETLEDDGDYKFIDLHGIEINGYQYYYSNKIISKTSASVGFSLEYEVNPIRFGNISAPQNATYNVIPDPNTPKIEPGNEDRFYNLKFNSPDASGFYLVELPWARYNQNGQNVYGFHESTENDQSSLLYDVRLELPKYFQDAAGENSTAYVIPEGFMYLKSFGSNGDEFRNLTYVYQSKYQFLVNLPATVGSKCLNGTIQMFVCVVGNDITTSLNDLQIKFIEHDHNASYGERAIDANSLYGLYKYQSQFNKYYVSQNKDNLISKYLHRDGYRYQSDPQNQDNKLLGDLLIARSNYFGASYKLIFGEANLDTSSLLPMVGNTNISSWIAEYGGNLQLISGSEGNNGIRIVSKDITKIASKNKNLFYIKEIDDATSVITHNSSSEDIESEFFSQTSYFNQTQTSSTVHSTDSSILETNNNYISVRDINNNPNIEIVNQPTEGHDDAYQSISLKKSQKEVSIKSNLYGSIKLKSKEFKIQDYNSAENSNLNHFKKQLDSSFSIVHSNLTADPNDSERFVEPLSITKTDNTNIKREGRFVYFVQHLVEDNPDYETAENDWSLQNFRYRYVAQDASFFDSSNSNVEQNKAAFELGIHQRQIFNKTYDFVRDYCLANNLSYFSNCFKEYTDPEGSKQDVIDINKAVGESLIPTMLFWDSDRSGRYNKFDWIDETSVEYFLKRWYKDNPYPTSLEYIYRHFYMHTLYDEEGNDGRNAIYYRTTMHRFLQTYSNYTTERAMQDRQDLCYDKTRILTKMIWRKYWLKESNSDFSLDFDSIFDNNSDLSNSKAVLVDQGIVVDMIDEFSNSELQQELEGQITFERAMKRVCKFYKPKQAHLKILTSGDNPVYNPQDDELIKYGSIYVPASPATNRFAKITEFFNKYEEHTFEEDDNVIVFGKGFVNFLSSRNPESNNATTYEPLFDSAYDEQQDNDNGILGIKRQLSIKFISDNNIDRNIQKSKNLKILFSDFISEVPSNNNINANNDPEYYCLTQGVKTTVPQFMRHVSASLGPNLFFDDYWLYLLRLNRNFLSTSFKDRYNSFYWNSENHLDDFPGRSDNLTMGDIDNIEEYPRTFFTQFKINFVNSTNNFHFATLKTLDGYQERLKKNNILINLCIYRKEYSEWINSSVGTEYDDIRRNLGPIQGFYDIQIDYLASNEIVNFYTPIVGKSALPSSHDRSISNMYFIKTNTYNNFTLLSSSTREGSN